jgi:peptide/nickel transport system permease protein
MSSLSRHTGFLAGLILTALVILAAASSTFYTPQDPLAMNTAARLQGPSGTHLLGTDQYGRDLLSRVMAGAVTSLSVGAIGVGMGMGMGILLGMIGGYFGGWLDEGLMRLMDALYGFPAVLSALLITAIVGPGIGVTMLAVGTASIPVFARLTRGRVFQLRVEEFVLAARSLGASDRVLILRHILPNCLVPLTVQAALTFPLAILAEAGLSYLGLGSQPPHPSWGLMLKEAQTFLSLSPWLAIIPGAAISATVLGLNLLGEGLRDLLDPRAH